VTDPDGDPVAITVTAITQDEDVNADAHGPTCPDGAGVGTPVGRLRWERSSKGNGRAYHVSFGADDARGGSCTGTVDVCVPLHRGGMCVDDGTEVDADGPPCSGTCPDICDIERSLAAAFCPDGPLPVRVDRRIQAARRALEHAARALSPATAKRLVLKSGQLLDTARTRLADAETASTIDAGCADALTTAFDATRARANTWIGLH
jgi:hypothetical protein